MKYYNDCTDDRTHGLCIYCGALPETREHVPSKIFLDEPYPSNLHIVEACTKCNLAYSLDEEYLACLIDCIIAGESEPHLVYREKIRSVLMHTPALAKRIANAKRETKDGIIFDVEINRVKNIIKKIASGHVFYELGILSFMEDADINITPFPCMTSEDIFCFENYGSGELVPWPEVGSRALQRLLIPDETYEHGWIHVQRGRYRYSVSQTDSIVVRMVFSEYLACLVRWEQ